MTIETKEIYELVSRGKREWEQTFDAVPDLIFITDTHHTIIRANRAVAKRCGLRPEEVPGRKCYELFHDPPCPPPFCPHLRVLEGRGEQEAEIEAKDLGVFDVTISPLYGAAGSITSTVHVARDITERKKGEEYRILLEHQLQQAQKWESLGVLAGGMAHDFNNILMIIVGHCYLAKDATNKEACRRHLGRIEEAADRAAELCKQMLIYAGKTPLVETELDLRLLVDETIGVLKQANWKKVSFMSAMEKELPRVRGDEGKIRQMVMNLALNAVEAIGEESGTVMVGLDEREVRAGDAEVDFFGSAIGPGRYACLEISDTGCGIVEETQKRIFEPFFSTKFTGRGLGMSAIIGIIKSHKGALQLSSAPGIGTTFRIFLPFERRTPEKAAAADAAVPPPAKKSAAMPRGTALVVDDEPELRRIGAGILEALGFSTVCATNGREAVELFRDPSSDIDLVFMDLTMPEMNGNQAFLELRESAPTLPIVICSGYGNEDVSWAIREDPYAGFLHKPYRVQAVSKMVERLLAARGGGDRG